MRQEVKDLIDNMAKDSGWSFDEDYHNLDHLSTSATNKFMINKKTSTITLEMKNGWIFKWGKITIRQLNKDRTIKLTKEEIVYADKVIKAAMKKMADTLMEECHEMLKNAFK